MLAIILIRRPRRAVAGVGAARSIRGGVQGLEGWRRALPGSLIAYLFSRLRQKVARSAG